MGKRGVDRFWDVGLQVAMPVTLVTAVTDGTIRDMLFKVWEDPTPWRMLFLFSFGFVLLGLSRNSARLRRLSEAQAGTAGGASAKTRPARTETAPIPLPPLHDEG